MITVFLDSRPTPELVFSGGELGGVWCVLLKKELFQKHVPVSPHSIYAVDFINRRVLLERG